MLYKDLNNVKNPADVRTIIAATEPMRFRDDYTMIFLKVWYEELELPILTVATPFDSERHCKELWIRAMAGEYGPIEVLPHDLDMATPSFLISADMKQSMLMLSYPNDKLPLAVREAMKQIAPPRVIQHDSHG